MCCNFCFCDIYQFINNVIISLSVIIQSTHYSVFCKLLSDFYLGILGVVGFLAVYRMQFYENNIKENRDILIRYASVLKSEKQEDHGIEWYSYMTDSELEVLVEERIIPQHKADFRKSQAKFGENVEKYCKSFASQPDKIRFIDELKRVWHRVELGKGSAVEYKDLSFNAGDFIEGVNINEIVRLVHDIKESTKKAEAFQRRLEEWKHRKDTWEHFKQTCYKLLIALVSLLAFFSIIQLFVSIEKVLPSSLINLSKVFIWFGGTISIGFTLYYLKKFIFICLEKDERKEFLGDPP